MERERERITLEEAVRRGYIYGPMGANHATGRTIVAPLSVIGRFSQGGLFDVATLERIREDQLEPEPAGDIPMEGRPA